MSNILDSLFAYNSAIITMDYLLNNSDKYVSIKTISSNTNTHFDNTKMIIDDFDSKGLIITGVHGVKLSENADDLRKFHRYLIRTRG